MRSENHKGGQAGLDQKILALDLFYKVATNTCSFYHSPSESVHFMYFLIIILQSRFTTKNLSFVAITKIAKFSKSQYQYYIFLIIFHR